jgi:Zn-dependent protease
MTGAPLIGWAKPVPVDLRNLRNGRRDFMLVALAGPVSNILIAIVASVLTRVLLGPVDAPVGPNGVYLEQFLVMTFQLNLLLAVFNMIPVPPLDGGNVLAGLLPSGAAQAFDRLRPYGIFILYGLLLTGTLRLIINPPYQILRRLLTL